MSDAMSVLFGLEHEFSIVEVRRITPARAGRADALPDLGDHLVGQGHGSNELSWWRTDPDGLRRSRASDLTWATRSG
jgi:hypothetical protein